MAIPQRGVDGDLLSTSQNVVGGATPHMPIGHELEGRFDAVIGRLLLFLQHRVLGYRELGDFSLRNSRYYRKLQE